MSAEVCLILASQKNWIQKEMFLVRQTSDYAFTTDTNRVWGESPILLKAHLKHEPVIGQVGGIVAGLPDIHCHRLLTGWTWSLIIVILPRKFVFNRVDIHCNALYRVQLFSKYASGLLRGSIIINSQFTSLWLKQKNIKYCLFLQVEKQMDN